MTVHRCVYMRECAYTWDKCTQSLTRRAHIHQKCIAKPIAALPRLQQLNFFRNRLGDEGSAMLCKQLSLGVCAPNLHTLWLSDNNIHTFPDDVLKIPGLVRLFLSANKIKRIPQELGLLEKLTLVDADHNPTAGLPEEVYYRGMTRLPGPRWDVLRPIFRNQMGLDLPDDDATPRDVKPARTPSGKAGWDNPDFAGQHQKNDFESTHFVDSGEGLGRAAAKSELPRATGWRLRSNFPNFPTFSVAAPQFD